MPYSNNIKSNRGFTLIEMSIVMVIIGLIIGGVLVGQDLINAASIRAQISQIEKYQTAVRTFQGKYGYLPGDMPASVANMYGFAARAGTAAQGDGDGVIANNYSGMQAYESHFFWLDLSDGGLIPEKFTVSIVCGAYMNEQIRNYFPTSKLGDKKYIYVYSGGVAVVPASFVNPTADDNTNYFGIVEMNRFMPCAFGNSTASNTPSIRVSAAYNIDKKIDDGLPQSGNVTATYAGYWSSWHLPIWVGASSNSFNLYGSPTNKATAGSSTTCYDNNNGSGVQQYSMSQGGGAGLNCALSFKFQ